MSAETNYLLAHELLATATWIAAQSQGVGVHLDRINRAVQHLRGEYIQPVPGEESPNTIHESPRRDIAWLIRNDVWAAAIAAHVRAYDADRPVPPSSFPALSPEEREEFERLIDEYAWSVFGWETLQHAEVQAKRQAGEPTDVDLDVRLSTLKAIKDAMSRPAPSGER